MGARHHGAGGGEAGIGKTWLLRAFTAQVAATARVLPGSCEDLLAPRTLGRRVERLPAGLADRYRLLDQIPPRQRPVVFVGPFEHYSNELPWRESVADVVAIAEDRDGHIDLTELEAQLLRFADRPLRIGSFSAASNVTGILTDADRVAALLHRHGALSFWDHAAAAPTTRTPCASRPTSSSVARRPQACW
jgi:hypothetical protein